MNEHTPYSPPEESTDEPYVELRPRFKLGQVVATTGALGALEEAGENPLGLLLRHATGDWRELPEEDRAENERSVEQGFRIVSAYTLDSGTKVWVITEWDRSVTTLLLPEEY